MPVDDKYQSTGSKTPDDLILQQRRYENFKSHNIKWFFVSKYYFGLPVDGWNCNSPFKVNYLKKVMKYLDSKHGGESKNSGSNTEHKKGNK